MAAPLEVERPTGLYEPARIIDFVERRERMRGKRPLKVFAHSYQPPREFLLLSQVDSGSPRVDIVADVNERIHSYCYKPVFIDRPAEHGGLAPGATFSFFGTLREWMMGHRPEDFEKIKATFDTTPDKEYRILGDPYLHVILPLLGEADQRMLIRIGREAFFADFGFYSEGLWLPETGVSGQTLRAAYLEGVRFVVLRDTQLRSTETNPVEVPLKNRAGGRIGTMAVVHFDSEISGSVSLPQLDNDITHPVEKFLTLDRFAHKGAYTIGTDTEYYGEHQPFKDQLLYAVTDQERLRKFGFVDFDIPAVMNGEEKKETDIVERSSWSCDHQLGRWEGTCYCGTHDPQIVKNINDLYVGLKDVRERINGKLDAIDPNWRDIFVPYFLGVRRSMYVSGDFRQDVVRLQEQPKMELLRNPIVELLFRAKLAELTGETSCFGFFRDSNNRPERAIAQLNTQEARNLLATATALSML